MASVCEVCGKKPSWGMSVSHSHRRTKRRWNPNIQRVRALVERHRQAGQRLHRLHQVGQGHQGPGLAPPSPRSKPLTGMQGVVKAYDPVTGDGVVMCDTDLADYDLAADALDGSVLRMVRQGQRVIFDLDADGPRHQAAPRLRGRHADTRRAMTRRRVADVPAPAGAHHRQRAPHMEAIGR